MQNVDGPEKEVSRPNGDGARSAPSGVWKDRYSVEKELGRGGFGVVYLARDQQLLSKPVVVKVLQEESSDPWFHKKFRQEIEALARIDHPGVVGVLDVGETPEGKPFLVMQFVEGVTLRSQIEPGGMEFRRAAHILRQVGHALGAAHDKGVWHRDLKPENIMLQRAGENEEYVKLIDFGIAAVKDSQVPSQTQVSKIVGTTTYMAPEQMAGEASAASDVYAFGVIAYEVLTGERPKGLPQSGAMTPRQLRPAVPPAAEALILNALSFRAEDRQLRSPEFGDRLASALGVEPTITQPLPALRSSPAAASEPASSSGLEMAYVLFMDLVGYSALPMDRQSQRIQQLQEIVRSTPEFRRAQQSDQLISLPSGDGMALVFFQNPVAPVQCAIEIARGLKNYPELKLRMGIHTGPVYRIADINTNRNVAGGGINLAQRVMDCGDAGHILVSKTVADILAQLSDWTDHLHEIGDHEVKHGVRLSLVNLHTGEVGNPEPPETVRISARSPHVAGATAPAHPLPSPARRPATSLLWAGGALALVVTAAVAGRWPSSPAAPDVPVQPAAVSPSQPAAVEPAAPASDPLARPADRPPALVPPAPTRDDAPAGGEGLPPDAAAAADAPARGTAPEPAGARARPATDESRTDAAREVAPREATPPADAQSSPPARAADPAVLQLRERLILLSARAAAVSRSMQTIEAEQSRQGVSMRPDMAAALQSMEYLLSEAESSLSAGDAEMTKRNLDLAERQLEKVETFLGR